MPVNPPVFHEAVGSEHVGAVGHYVGALLQTAGLYGQSSVISQLSSMIEALGVLIYVIALVGAISSVALWGNYKQAFYFLIGPALFHFTLFSTVQSEGTQLRFGEYHVEESTADQRAFLSLVDNGQPDPDARPLPRVSWFYAVYDSVVSEVTQNVVSFLLDTKNRRHLLAVAKERTFTRLLSMRSDSPGFLRLLAFGVMGSCGEATAINIELASGDFDSSIYGSSEAELKAKRDRLMTQAVVVIEEPTIRTYLLEKLGNDAAESIDQPVSCNQIWDLVWKTAQIEWAEIEKRIEERGIEAGSEDDGVPWQELMEEVREHVGDGDPAAAAQVFAAVLIRNSLKHTSHGAMTSQLFDGKAMHAPVAEAIYGATADAYATGYKLRMEYFEALIPYFQGLFLFGLTLAFPFFTIFLLTPGKFEGFVTWMGLWLWVKSWDVGFAFVAFIKDLLGQYIARDYFARDSYSNNLAELNVPDAVPFEWEDPSAIFRIATEGDLGATSGTYATITMLLTVSIPVITAHLTIGATGLLEVLKLGIDKPAERFGEQHKEGRRRDYATNVSRRIHKRAAEEAREAAKRAEHNPGSVDRFDSKNGKLKNEDGSMNGSRSYSRDQMFDGTHANHIKAQADRARYNYQFSNEHHQDRALLSAVTGRRMTYSISSDSEMTNAFTNDLREQFTGTAPGGGNQIWGADKAAMELSAAGGSTDSGAGKGGDQADED